MKYNSNQIFGPGGILADTLPNYEYRIEQEKMADQVHSCLHNANHGVIEAGTGVGKSLAYLIPAIYYAITHKKRVIIATNTINLQEQLYQKDVPTLKQLLPVEFEAKIFKGRSNYLCRRRLIEVHLGILSEPELTPYTEKLFDWSQASTTGDRSDLPLAIPEQVWRQVCCQRENCPEEACSFFKDCFYWQLRHKLSKAQLIITNHALFLSDLVTENSVLPKYDGVIIDEAHNLESVATNSFSHKLYPQTLTVYYRVGLQLYFQLRTEMQALELENLRQLLDDFNNIGISYFEQIKPHVNGYTTMIDEKNRQLFNSPELINKLKEIKATLAIIKLEGKELIGLNTQFQEYTVTMLTDLELIMTASDPNYVYWAEVQNADVGLEAAPIKIDHLLNEHLFRTVKSVIMTSATIATGQNFDFFKDSIGIVDAQELLLGSPFNYPKQAVLCIPKSVKKPTDPEYNYFNAHYLLHVLARTKGGVLGLFTSYQDMNNVADLMEEKLTEVGYRLLVQGDDDRHKLLAEFMNTKQSILLGTNSFWEGIDLPGDKVKAVVIARIPFAVPDRPVTAARLQAITDSGGNAFQEYSLPNAIIRLKQGFGRLIRTKHDQGTVVILDQRIITANYGKQLLISLPPAKFSRNLDDIVSVK